MITANDVLAEVLKNIERKIEREEFHLPYDWADVEIGKRHLAQCRTLTAWKAGERAVVCSAADSDDFGYVAGYMLDTDHDLGEAAMITEITPNMYKLTW